MSEDLQQSNSLQSEMRGINYLVPNAICKLLAGGSILINLYWSKNHEVQLMGMGVATLFSFAFGYFIIISFNLCLAYEIGRKKNCFNDIGIYYQRALVINFIICAFLISPLLYISKTIVQLFVHIDQSLANIIGDYLFQLVPSIYCFAFYDTTQTFLLAQSHFLAPLVVNIFGFFCHFFFIGFMDAAWSRNITDFGCCVAILIHLSLKKNKLESWIEWTIQCFKGWENHLRFYKNIGLTNYAKALFYFLFAVLGYDLPRPDLICHICFINIMQIIFLINIGLKDGLVAKLGYFVKNKDLTCTRSLIFKSVRIFFAVSLFLVFLMLMYISQICDFFLTSLPSKEIFMNKYWVMLITILTDSLNMSLFTIIKAAFNKGYSLLNYQLTFILVESTIAYLLCYKFQSGLSGLWYGWIMGSSFNSIFSWVILMKNQKKQQKMKYNKHHNKYEALMGDKKQYDDSDL